LSPPHDQLQLLLFTSVVLAHPSRKSATKSENPAVRKFSCGWWARGLRGSLARRSNALPARIPVLLLVGA
jgi:hypothetical protein